MSLIKTTKKLCFYRTVYTKKRSIVKLESFTLIGWNLTVIKWFACRAKLLSADWLRQGIFFLITRTVLEIKRAWILDADWLRTPALSWFPASNGFWKGMSETHRFWVWSKHGYFILTWTKINMQQSAVFWWKSKRIFPTETVLIRSLKKVWVGTAVVARSIELQNFMAAKCSLASALGQLRINFTSIFKVFKIALVAGKILWKLWKYSWN